MLTRRPAENVRGVLAPNGQVGQRPPHPWQWSGRNSGQSPTEQGHKGTPDATSSDGKASREGEPELPGWGLPGEGRGGAHCSDGHVLYLDNGFG